MNTSSTTPSGLSSLRTVRAASVAAVAAIALSATVGLGIVHASASATAAPGAVTVSAMGRGSSPAEPDPYHVGLPSIGEWRHGHHGG
jgi:IMP dehydrogenase/GMP reductase